MPSKPGDKETLTKKTIIGTNITKKDAGSMSTLLGDTKAWFHLGKIIWGPFKEADLKSWTAEVTHTAALSLAWSLTRRKNIGQHKMATVHHTASFFIQKRTGCDPKIAPPTNDEPSYKERGESKNHSFECIRTVSQNKI
ncbi:hypothetical protein LSTR_LSTR000287 [Laodelphax striatellus]|uniref:Uncharacterized protein n=1 Tax=Laodelphax striatellus TaxID=195883 RepID=A0A482X781_LAOST|nr:hypothetical protein LSTR_LSTR000287 [Laodelphax striatellus]